MINSKTPIYLYIFYCPFKRINNSSVLMVRWLPQSAPYPIFVTNIPSQRGAGFCSVVYPSTQKVIPYQAPGTYLDWPETIVAFSILLSFLEFEEVCG